MLDAGKQIAKTLARAILGDYAAYYIYVSPGKLQDVPQREVHSSRNVRRVFQSEVESSKESLIRDQAFYLGEDALAYASYLDDRIAGLCIYWYGERYRKRNFWSLKDREAKLVQIITVPGHRGAGIATELITLSCMDVLEGGFDRAYARIWHSNAPSIRAFEHAGWTRFALVLDLNPLRLSKPTRLQFGPDRDAFWRGLKKNDLPYKARP